MKSIIKKLFKAYLKFVKHLWKYTNTLDLKNKIQKLFDLRFDKNTRIELIQLYIVFVTHAEN